MSASIEYSRLDTEDYQSEWYPENIQNGVQKFENGQLYVRIQKTVQKNSLYQCQIFRHTKLWIFTVNKINRTINIKVANQELKEKELLKKIHKLAYQKYLSRPQLISHYPYYDAVALPI